MTFSDQILICRDGKTYRADFSALSSIILFNAARDSFLKNLDEVSSSIEALTGNFEDVAYSKSEMKTTFSTKENVDGLTANALYVLTSAAKTETDKLVSKNALNQWEQEVSRGSVDRLIRGYEDAVNLVNAGAIEADRIEEYSHKPQYSNIAP